MGCWSKRIRHETPTSIFTLNLKSLWKMGDARQPSTEPCFPQGRTEAGQVTWKIYRLLSRQGLKTCAMCETYLETNLFCLRISNTCTAVRFWKLTYQEPFDEETRSISSVNIVQPNHTVCLDVPLIAGCPHNELIPSDANTGIWDLQRLHIKRFRGWKSSAQCIRMKQLICRLCCFVYKDHALSKLSWRKFWNVVQLSKQHATEFATTLKQNDHKQKARQTRLKWPQERNGFVPLLPLLPSNYLQPHETDFDDFAQQRFSINKSHFGREHWCSIPQMQTSHAESNLRVRCKNLSPRLLPYQVPWFQYSCFRAPVQRRCLAEAAIISHPSETSNFRQSNNKVVGFCSETKDRRKQIFAFALNTSSIQPLWSLCVFWWFCHGHANESDVNFHLLDSRFGCVCSGSGSSPSWTSIGNFVEAGKLILFIFLVHNWRPLRQSIELTEHELEQTSHWWLAQFQIVAKGQLKLIDHTTKCHAEFILSILFIHEIWEVWKTTNTWNQPRTTPGNQRRLNVELDLIYSAATTTYHQEDRKGACSHNSSFLFPTDQNSYRKGKWFPDWLFYKLNPNHVIHITHAKRQKSTPDLTRSESTCVQLIASTSGTSGTPPDSLHADWSSLTGLPHCARQFVTTITTLEIFAWSRNFGGQ